MCSEWQALFEKIALRSYCDAKAADLKAQYRETRAYATYITNIKSIRIHCQGATRDEYDSIACAIGLDARNFGV